MSLTIRVLDAVRGRAAPDLPLRVDRYDGRTWQAVTEDVTGPSGETELALEENGLYRARLGTGQYFTDARFPEIQVIFDFAQGDGLEIQVTPASYTACHVRP